MRSLLVIMVSAMIGLIVSRLLAEFGIFEKRQ